MRLSRLILIMACALPCTSFAVETRTIPDIKGNPAFELRFFNTEDGPYDSDSTSTWNLPQVYRDKSTEALKFWLEILQPRPGYLPGTINIGTYNIQNAESSSPGIVHGGLQYSLLEAALLGMDPGPVDAAHSFVTIGKMDFDQRPYEASQLPLTPFADMNGTIFHEFAHSLGLSSTVSNPAADDADDDDSDRKVEHAPRFSFALNRYSQMLRDDNGNPGRPHQNILCTGCITPVTPDAFDVRKDQGYLIGDHVREALAGSMPGIPVKILGEDGNVDDNYMSHTELAHSMMSHQPYSNYTSFMEVELALMQDLGYTLDRRNFFGRSIYGSNLTIDNNDGYFQRNANGSGYLAGQYNQATLGVGLHIYGSHNTVRQQADLLTRGPAGAGVRIDGQGNTLIVPQQTRVHADGQNGRGVMFAYGKDHVFVQRGEVQALGANGIGASFDFGNSSNGNKDAYRGSYIQTKEAKPVADMLDELRGPLVSRYDLTGTLRGRQAAINISSNALVGRINVMQGALIDGDIVSSYGERDEHDRLRLTTLSFGLQADGEGRSTGLPDSFFDFDYSDNITGNNLSVVLEGGHTSLDGNHAVHDLRVAPGATLSGNGRYKISTEGAFVNQGTITPGQSLGRIEITGDFVQTAEGQLIIEVDPQVRHDILAVQGQASLDGSLVLAAEPGWYASDWSLPVSQMLPATSYVGRFSDVSVQWSSPTLNVTADGAGGGQLLAITRRDNAYSQWGDDDSSRSLGLALAGLARQARTDMQEVYRGLDFSAPDGSAVTHALHQMSPAAYSTLFTGGTQRERLVGDLVDQLNYAPQAAGAEWRGYAIPFGHHSWQETHDSQVGFDASHYGLLIGGERRLPSDWTFGVLAAASRQTINTRLPQDARGKASAFQVGVHARHEPDPQAGLHMAFQGRLGIDRSSMDRRLSLAGGYQAAHHAEWTGYTGVLRAQTGYRWALSDHLSLGPIAGLDYVRQHQPSIEESGPDATRLSVESRHLDSLRARLGAEAKIRLSSADSSHLLTGRLQIVWERELLDTSLTQHAHFSGYPDHGFQSRNTVASRNTLATRLGLSYARDEKLTINGNLAAYFSGSGQRSVAATLGANWRF